MADRPTRGAGNFAALQIYQQKETVGTFACNPLKIVRSASDEGEESLHQLAIRPRQCLDDREVVRSVDRQQTPGSPRPTQA
jgi:hypothetical protein